MEFKTSVSVIIILAMACHLCSGLPRPDEPVLPDTQKGVEGSQKPSDEKLIASALNGDHLAKGPIGGLPNTGDDPPPPPGPEKKPVTNPDPLPQVAESDSDCNTECLLNHQNTIIIFICILVCIILLIVILFGCYFMKKLHGKSLLTTDHVEIVRRRGPPTRVYVSPEEYTEKLTETKTIPGDNPDEQKIVTTTTTKTVSKTPDETL